MRYRIGMYTWSVTGDVYLGLMLENGETHIWHFNQFSWYTVTTCVDKLKHLSEEIRSELYQHIERAATFLGYFE